MASTALGTGITVPVDYTSRDYSSLLADLMNSIPTYLPEWGSTSASDLGIALLELFAYVGDIENYYIDRIANEAFLATAQQRSSVLNIAYLIDYAPNDATPATAVLTLILRPSTGAFILPEGTQFSTSATATTPAVVFETTEDISMTNTTTSPVSVGGVVVVQGITISGEALGTSNGNANQQYTLFNTGVIAAAVQVYVDEGLGAKPWTLVATLADAGPYDTVFELAEDANGIFYVVFGDGASGRIPNPQAVITATYRVGGGSIGNVGANQIMVDLSGTSYFSSLSNPNAAVGGADPETIAQIQVNAPKSLAAANRCVSLQDYASVALAVAGVAKASAVASSGLSVNLYVHPAGGPFLHTDLAVLVTALAPTITWGGAGETSPTGQSGYLDPRKMVGWSIVVLPPQIGGSTGYVEVALSVSVQVLPPYTNLQVQQDVLTAINTLFDFGSMDFGQRLTLSSVYHALQTVPGVDYLNVTDFYRADGSAGVGDIVCQPWEIPVVGDPNTGTNLIVVTVTGGL